MGVLLSKDAVIFPSVNEPILLPDLETALTAVYRGPLEDFVARRDALVKQLRTLKRRAEADQAKALRKPSRMAWALNSAVHQDPAAVETLALAITAALDAQMAGGIDLRTTLDTVRTAARALANAAAAVAGESGHAIDAATLVQPIMNVTGDADAFAALRAGRLTDVPEGGGLGFLAAAPPAGTTPVSAPMTEPALKRDVQRDKKSDAARAALGRAESALEAAKARTSDAQSALRQAQIRLDAAEAALRRAEADVSKRSSELDRAKQEFDEAAAQERSAEAATEQARKQIDSSLGLDLDAR